MMNEFGMGMGFGWIGILLILVLVVLAIAALKLGAASAAGFRLPAAAGWAGGAVCAMAGTASTLPAATIRASRRSGVFIGAG